MSFPMAPAAAPAPGADDLAAISYDQIPYIPREWLWNGYIPVADPVLLAAAGETGKGLLLVAVAARIVLGLPFPGEDQELRRDPRRVVWISGPGEDDQFADLAPRFRAAIAMAVAEFELDASLAGEEGAITLVSDLSYWPDDNPVSLPADCARVTAEIKKMNKSKTLPPVALLVADSLSALLSQGFTIDSRQGATRVMVKLSRMARTADVALALIHHLTKDGKVAGSPAVLNALRLAFVIERSPDNPDVRLITRHKSNISGAQPQCYVVAGQGPATRAQFTDAAGTRAERMRQAAKPAPEAGESVRARMAAAACCDPASRGKPGQCSDCPSALADLRSGPLRAADGPFRLMRRVQAPGQPAGEPERVGDDYATRDAAKAAAFRDAGMVLVWKPAGMAGTETAGTARADGSRAAYLVARASSLTPGEYPSDRT